MRVRAQVRLIVVVSIAQNVTLQSLHYQNKIESIVVIGRVNVCRRRFKHLKWIIFHVFAWHVHNSTSFFVKHQSQKKHRKENQFPWPLQLSHTPDIPFDLTALENLTWKRWQSTWCLCLRIGSKRFNNGKVYNEIIHLLNVVFSGAFKPTNIQFLYLYPLPPTFRLLFDLVFVPFFQLCCMCGNCKCLQHHRHHHWMFNVQCSAGKWMMNLHSHTLGPIGWLVLDFSLNCLNLFDWHITHQIPDTKDCFCCKHFWY